MQDRADTKKQLSGNGTDMGKTEPKISNYTCNDYREEMILLGLQKQLAKPDLTRDEKEKLIKEIAVVEKQMGLD